LTLEFGTQDGIFFQKYPLKEFCQQLAVKVFANSLFYPLANVKVLMQIGYEPFPLTLGKKFGIGKEQYFLPNAFTYAKNLIKTYSWTCLFNGLDANICYFVTSNGIKFITLDEHYPNYGGRELNSSIKEDELSDVESRQRVLRNTVRNCTSQIIAVVVARPFAVVMVRKIAQIVGNEAKYSGVISSLILIGREEGPKGLFSGLVPQIIREFLAIVSVNAIMYVGKRLFKREDVAKIFFERAVPMIVNNIFYSYDVVSTVMGVAGSCLAASMLPYSPVFGNWQEAWNYLDAKQGLGRGSRLFLRQYNGPISIGAGGNVFASNKHFV
uniref:ADP,ATP carrier protein n=1 Tax=Syphacia muris TaxID=451379 RepID=A0A0N5AID3_9BILA